MASCHEMKKGDIYICKDCGLELQVIKECKNSDIHADDCACHDDESQCEISCCGKELEKK